MSTGESLLSAYPSALRVYQWPKNFIVFAALIFGQQVQHSEQLIRSVIAFAVLCGASSAFYILNDLVDIEKDRAHPEKRSRPIAGGLISKGHAIVLIVLLAGASLTVAWILHPTFFAAVLMLLLLNVAYSFVLKKIMIIDVLSIAIGFVIRAIAGALVLQVGFSNWLVVCTLFLALFLGLGKRRREIGLLDEEAIKHREVLGHYSVPYLDSLMIILAGTTLLAYAIYTCSPEVVQRTGTDKLYLTLPFVLYGLFRYLFLVHHKEGGGDPSRTLIRDVPMLATVTLWGLASGVIVYFGKGL